MDNSDSSLDRSLDRYSENPANKFCRLSENSLHQRWRVGTLETKKDSERRERDSEKRAHNSDANLSVDSS